jgi:hypothetical protein
VHDMIEFAVNDYGRVSASGYSPRCRQRHRSLTPVEIAILSRGKDAALSGELLG